MAFITSKNESRQPMFLVTTSILLLLSTVVVSLRIYCRISHIRHVGPDDYFMVAALAVTIGMGIQNGFHVSWGTGQHGADLPFEIILEPTLKHWYAYQLIYPWSLFFVKASILALYHRIFTQGRFKFAIYGVMTFVTIYTVVVFFVNAFECRSMPSRAWAPTFPEGCNNLPATYYSSASINILTDAIILIMPMRAFRQLNLQRKKRLALMGVFLIGGIAVIASIVRLYAVWVYTTAVDVAYDAIFILLLSQIEVNVAIISASAPALRPLFKNTFLSSSYSQSNKYGAGYSGNGGASNIFTARRSRSYGQMELQSFGEKESVENRKSTEHGISRNNSEERILPGAGIMKTVQTDIDLERSQ